MSASMLSLNLGELVVLKAGRPVRRVFHSLALARHASRGDGEKRQVGKVFRR